MSGSSGKNRGDVPPGLPEEDLTEFVVGGNDPQSSGELVVSLRGGVLGHYEESLGRELLGMAVGEQLDAFRDLRTRLLAIGAGVGLHRFTVLVVPITNESGASFIARNLAAAFTFQEHRRAVLVDCNLRNPTQHIAFGLPSHSDGLFEYIENPDASADRLLRRTQLDGLYLIPAGHPSSSTREYFSSDAMRAMLDWLRMTLFFLVLDGPPMKGAPDARILSEQADFVVLVAGYGRDTVDAIKEAASLFDPAKFAGVVFNEQA